MSAKFNTLTENLTEAFKKSLEVGDYKLEEEQLKNIETIEESDEDSEETIFNFSKDMTDADKCKKLREEYTRWNRQTNNSNEKIRNQARKMVELTANLRKKYNC